MTPSALPDRWIVLTYRVPREPTANRVYVWRKLKQLGAVALQDAAWVLPATPKTQEHLQWLAAEIAELGGQARLWEAALLLELGDESLRRRFEAAVTAECRAILAALRRRRRDLPALARRFQQVVARDYFASELVAAVRQRLLAARQEKRP